jgi:hypothetical protein
MEITMPTSYADITLGQYQRVAKLLREKRIIESNEDKIDFDCELLSILTGVDEGVFYAIPYSEYVKLIGKLSFLTEIPKAKMVHTLSINNKPYTVLNSVKDISAGDFIDLQEYQKNVDDNMHMILATLVRGEDWNSNNVPELAKHFQEKLTAEQAIGIALFFCNVSINFVQLIGVYSQATMEQRKRMIKATTVSGLLQSMGGSFGLINWQTVKEKIGVTS